MANTEKRFDIIYKEGGAFTSIRKILLDTETGIKYLMVESGYGIALTPLLDKDGKPQTDERYGF